MRDGEPAYHATVTADKVAAHCVRSTPCWRRLLHRERTGGQGQLVEMPMFEAMAGFALNEHLMGATFADDAKTGYHRALSRNRKPYETADGWIAVLPYTAVQWSRVLKVVGREDVTAAVWFNDNAERSKKSDELYAILANSLGTRTSKEWLEIFEREDVPCGPINDTDELLDDPHLAAVGFFDPMFTETTPVQRTLRQPVLYRGMTREADRFAPRLGADTQALMAQLGYSDADVQRMTAGRIVKGPELAALKEM